MHTGRRGYAFALLAYAFAAIMLGTTMPSPMYALYADHLDFAVAETTVIYAAYAGGVLAALLISGSWSDAIGRRPMLLAGTLCALASAAVFLNADSIAQLLVGRVLSGLSAGLFTGTATAAVIEAAPPSWRTRAPAVATIANMGGLSSGPILAGLLVQYEPAPLQTPFVVHIVLVVLAAGAVLAVPETSSRSGKVRLQSLSVPAQVRPVFVIAGLATFAGFSVVGLFAAVAPAFVANVIGIDNHAVAGLTAGSLFAASAVAQIFAVRIPPQRGRHGVRHTRSRDGCSRCGSALFVTAGTDRSLSGVGYRSGHQLQPRAGGRHRRHANGMSRLSRLRLLRGFLHRDLHTRDRSGSGRAGLGSAYQWHDLRGAGRGARGGLSRCDPAPGVADRRVRPCGLMMS